jgi:predicted transcriptional regulator
MTKQNQYRPDYISSPGETLLETLDTIGMSQVELAKRMGQPVKTIHEIIHKQAIITATLPRITCSSSSRTGFSVKTVIIPQHNR